MDGFSYTIQDIVQATSLSRKYVDRCYEIMPFLKTYRKKSAENNKYFYSAGAFDVFQQIANLKEQGHDRRSIRDILGEGGLGNQAEEVKEGDRKAGTSPPDDNSDRVTVADLKEAHQKALDAKDETITALKSKMVLLEAGETNQVNRETELQTKIQTLNKQLVVEEEKQRQLKDLYTKASTLTGWFKRKELASVLKQIEELAV